MKHAVIKVSSWLLAALLAAVAGPSLAQVYKVVDENGNVVYTDRAPAADAQPMELPGLSVIEMIRTEPEGAAGSVEEAGEEEEEVSDIRELRRGYRDFSIVSPIDEETLWGTGGQVQIAWDTRYRLQTGMYVVLTVDGTEGDPTTQPVINMVLERGTHTVYAELFDRRNRKVATANPVTFNVQQYSVHYGANRRRGN